MTDSPAHHIDVLVRPYAEADYPACRSLWAELTEHHRRLYENLAIGGDDPGGGFDDYLATPERAGSWVAEAQGSAVGLLDHGVSEEVEPVVVAGAMDLAARRHGWLTGARLHGLDFTY